MVPYYVSNVEFDGLGKLFKVNYRIMYVVFIIKSEICCLSARSCIGVPDAIEIIMTTHGMKTSLWRFGLNFVYIDCAKTVCVICF
jgi:hypothetical protein